LKISMKSTFLKVPFAYSIIFARAKYLALALLLFDRLSQVG
jgi:hypothetical protein